MTAEELAMDSTVGGSFLAAGDPDAGETPESTVLIGRYAAFGALRLCSSSWMRLSKGVKQRRRKTSSRSRTPEVLVHPSQSRSSNTGRHNECNWHTMAYHYHTTESRQSNWSALYADSMIVFVFPLRRDKL